MAGEPRKKKPFSKFERTGICSGCKKVYRVHEIKFFKSDIREANCDE